MQQSDKHSPAVDDALKDPRIDEPVGYRHDARPEDDDLPAAEFSLSRPDVTSPSAPDPRAVQTRSELARFLEPSAFPADKATLLAVAGEQHAPKWVRETLAALPPDPVFTNIEEMWEALGGSSF